MGGGGHFYLAFDMGGIHLAGERDKENLAGEGFLSFLFGSLTSQIFPVPNLLPPTTPP